jgi:hypothetical protein
MSYSKLSIVNTCLLLKGQRPVSAEDDGSDEWNICSAAYDQGVAHAIEEHDWKFATEIDTLDRLGDSDDPDFEDEYAKPTGCLHLIWVRVSNVPTPYKIIGDAVQITAGGVDPTCKFVAEPGPEDWPAMFVSVINEYVFSGIESGIKKNQSTADGHLAKAHEFLQRAKTRTDQQEPKRALFKTRHRIARQTRRG